MSAAEAAARAASDAPGHDHHGADDDQRRARPVRADATVTATGPVGAYQHLVLHAPALAGALPGQFVAAAVGGDPTAMLLRRAFSVHRADPAAGTLELVVAAHGPGSTWVTRRGVGDTLDLVGPLGRPYTPPAGAGAAVLVGGGYGSAPLAWWARTLLAAGHRVAAVVGAGSADRLFDAGTLTALAEVCDVSTDDGSAGRAGRVTDCLGAVVADLGARDVYACGPMPMLRAVGDVAAAAGARAWVTVEESMACGVGVCMTCVLPVRDTAGVTRMTRACTGGPTFDAAAVRWDALRPGGGADVPADCVGAPRAGGH